MRNFADVLFDAIREKDSRLCVGIDPRPDDLPAELGGEEASASQAEAVIEFCSRIIYAVADVAVAVKFQSAFFEELGPAGIAGMEALASIARNAGLLTIADVKRGDIGSTAEAYAAAYLRGASRPLFDAITVSPYFGTDGVQPFIARAAQAGAGVFVVVRTSNPSAAELQDLVLADGRKFYQAVAELVAEWGRPYMGAAGYSLVGAVAGATAPEALADLRRRLPQQVLLVPGFGAQGAGAEDVVAAFDREGLGAIVNSARAIIYAYKSAEYAGRFNEAEFDKAAAEAARAARDEINRAARAASSG
ncbi:MAG: orotidine-5'-phosphate decarboxylase [Armatimonadetes bacterium]|nr:orotidine-5'-phosphate decarboxylase [Armatimonadota bacterium]